MHLYNGPVLPVRTNNEKTNCTEQNRRCSVVSLVSPIGRRAILLILGRNHMKFRPAFLLLGTVLIAALPVWADGIPHPGLAKETSGVLRLNKFQSTNNVDLWDSKSFVALDPFFSGLPDKDVYSAGLIDLTFLKNVSSDSHGRKYWSIKDGNRGWEGQGDKYGLDTLPVPEPESLSLLLVGLAAVGFLAGRGANWTEASHARQQYSTE